MVPPRETSCQVQFFHLTNHAKKQLRARRGGVERWPHSCARSAVAPADKETRAVPFATFFRALSVVADEAETKSPPTKMIC
jgi:hypothetical protein